MGEIVINGADLKEIADWLAENVGREKDARNLPLGHRWGDGWYLNIEYVGMSEWYTASVTIYDPEKLLLFILSHKSIYE